MSTNDRAWEHTLLAMAQQGLEHEATARAAGRLPGGLDAAYAACDDIANQHSHTFYMASRPLPVDKRKAVRSLYAFCRITDDLIDRADGNLAEGLAAWRECAMAWPPPCDNPVAVAWADTRARYQIPDPLCGAAGAGRRVRFAEEALCELRRARRLLLRRSVDRGPDVDAHHRLQRRCRERPIPTRSSWAWRCR